MHTLLLLPDAAGVHVPEHCLIIETLYQATNNELSRNHGYKNKN